MFIRGLFLTLIFSFFGLATFCARYGSKSNSKSVKQHRATEKPYVMLISIDAFRWDLADKYQAKKLA
jgi:flagellar basal body-associated protein FliL